MKKYHIWHNTNGSANQYFVARNEDGHVCFQIPKWLGRLLTMFNFRG